MASSGMLHRVALVRIDVSEELNASVIRVTRIGELGTSAVTSNRHTIRSTFRLLVTANVVPSSPILLILMTEALSSSETLVLTRNSPIPVTLMMEPLRSSEMSGLTRATRRNIPEAAILHSHRPENLKSYIALTDWDL
jgi:hypothetical protein